MLFLFVIKVYNIYGDTMDGFLLVDKHSGLTSHDVIYRVKRKLHLDKVGHTGTLDPFASGLMILCVGKATKLQSLFLNADKIYEGAIQFGKHYDTYDTTGTIIETSNHLPLVDDIKNGMMSFIGTYDQHPPMYSAIKHQGRKLYDLARQGIEIERETRNVSIYQFDFVDQPNQSTTQFIAHVSKGTYIRSLAVDLAARLDTKAALSSLRRLSIGSYHVDQAKDIDHLELSDLITLDAYFKDYPSITLSDYLIKLVKNGVYLDQRQIETDTPFIVKNEQGQMIAYYEVIEPLTYRPVLIF